MTETVEQYKDCIGTILNVANGEGMEKLRGTGYFENRADEHFTHLFKQLTVMHRHEEAAALAEWWTSHPSNPLNLITA